MQELNRYTVELHRPDGGWYDLRQATALARQVAAEMRDEGTSVRFLRSIFVPEDDACFFLYEGPSEHAIRVAADRARFTAQQVRKTIAIEQEEKA